MRGNGRFNRVEDGELSDGEVEPGEVEGKGQESGEDVDEGEIVPERPKPSFRRNSRYDPPRQPYRPHSSGGAAWDRHDRRPREVRGRFSDRGELRSPLSRAPPRGRPPSRESWEKRERVSPSVSNGASPDGASARDGSVASHDSKDLGSPAEPPCAEKLAQLQDLITPDTVGVEAAKRSLSRTCSTILDGLDVLEEAWKAEAAAGRVRALYRSAPWDDVRGALLSSLKAVHLVCTAGLAKGGEGPAPGLAALQRACAMTKALTNPSKPGDVSDLDAWRQALANLSSSSHSASANQRSKQGGDPAAASCEADESGAHSGDAAGLLSPTKAAPSSKAQSERRGSASAAAADLPPHLREFVSPGASRSDPEEAAAAQPTGPKPSDASTAQPAAPPPPPPEASPSKPPGGFVPRISFSLKSALPEAPSAGVVDREGVLDGLAPQKGEVADDVGGGAAAAADAAPTRELPRGVSADSAAAERSVEAAPAPAPTASKGAAVPTPAPPPPAAAAAAPLSAGAPPDTISTPPEPPPATAAAARASTRRSRWDAAGAAPPAPQDALPPSTEARPGRTPPSAPPQHEPPPPPPPPAGKRPMPEEPPRDLEPALKRPRPAHSPPQAPPAPPPHLPAAAAVSAAPQPVLAPPPPTPVDWPQEEALTPPGSPERPPLGAHPRPAPVKTEADASGRPAGPTPPVAEALLEEEPLTPPSAGAPPSPRKPSPRASPPLGRSVDSPPRFGSGAPPRADALHTAARSGDRPDSVANGTLPHGSLPPELPEEEPLTPPDSPVRRADAAPAAEDDASIPPHLLPPPSPPPTAVPPPPSQPDTATVASDLISAGRLALVIMLEGVLVDVLPEEAAAPSQPLLEALARSPGPNNNPPSGAPPLQQLPHSRLWLKLRPSCQSFLATCASFYRLWLVTQLSVPEVTEILSVIDPSGDLFGDRVTSAPSAALRPGALSLSLLPGLAPLLPFTLALDDAYAGRWTDGNDASHVLHCERYPFFPTAAAPDGASLLTLGRDEDPYTGMLACSLETLLLLHHKVLVALQEPPSVVGGALSFAPWDAPSVMAAARASVLTDVRVAFSRGVTAPWRGAGDLLLDIARQFGATCSGEVNTEMTHLVARELDGNEAAWVEHTKCSVVQPAWLLCCALTWQHVREQAFALQ